MLGCRHCHHSSDSASQGMECRVAHICEMERDQGGLLERTWQNSHIFENHVMDVVCDEVVTDM